MFLCCSSCCLLLPRARLAGECVVVLRQMRRVCMSAVCSYCYGKGHGCAYATSCKADGHTHTLGSGAHCCTLLSIVNLVGRPVTHMSLQVWVCHRVVVCHHELQQVLLCPAAGMMCNSVFTVQYCCHLITPCALARPASTEAGTMQCLPVTCCHACSQLVDTCRPITSEQYSSLVAVAYRQCIVHDQCARAVCSTKCMESAARPCVNNMALCSLSNIHVSSTHESDSRCQAGLAKSVSWCHSLCLAAFQLLLNAE